MFTEPLLIVGWSARAAAQSARRAGFKVNAIDAFGDVDLRQSVDDWRRLHSFDRLRQTAMELPPGPWMYAGGLENHPKVVADLSCDRLLCGNHATNLRRVRDPFVLQSTLAEFGFFFPETRRSADDAVGAAWLVKRFRSGGGLGVRMFDGRPMLSQDEYLQYRVPGTEYGVSYVAADGRSQLLGVCRALPDDDAKHSFRYRGSIGPMPLSPSLRAELERLGDVLAKRFQLVGLFGVDVIFDGERIWTLEVNPRYTASMELLERAAGRSFVEAHVVAFREAGLSVIGEASTRMLYGKRIVYHDGADPLHVSASPELADLADLPASDTVVQPGEPLLTVFVAGATFDEVAEQLLEREREIRSSRL